MIRRLRIALLSAALGAWVILIPPAHAAAPTVEIRSYAVLAQTGAELTLLGSVTGAASPGAVKIQQYTSGAWGPLADVTTSGSGTYTHTFVLTATGNTYYRAVVPASGSTPAATSATKRVYVHAASANPYNPAPSPTVTGDHVVGGTLTAEVEPWTPKPPRYHYRWNRDGVPTKSYGRQHVLTSEDFGKYMTVTVAAYVGDSPTYRESRPAASPVVRGAFTANDPTILGSPVVGETLRADVSDWSPKPTTVTHRWMRDGQTIEGATGAEYVVKEEDAQTSLSVEVRGEGAGLDPVTRTSAPVPIDSSSGRTFEDVIKPQTGSPPPASEVTFEAVHAAPAWGTNARTRWDNAGAFTHSLKPQPLGTLFSKYTGANYASPALGAEYVATNSAYRNADVSFKVTGRRFAIAYRTYTNSDAMVWIDDRPLSSSPIEGWDGSTNRSGSPNWIVVTLPERKTVTVRFAGPLHFTGVDAPAADSVQVVATPPPFTLGVIGDSYFTTCAQATCMSRSPAPMLSTLTGFRVWNLAEGGSGYIAKGGGFQVAGYESTPFGSDRRIEAIKNAPIDALLVNGSVNDGFTASVTTAQHRAALDAFLTRVKEVRPDLPVVLVGLEPIAFARTTYWKNSYSPQTSNLASTVGRHRSVLGFIDPYTDPWLSGTGSISTPKGDGNQDSYMGSDGLHLSAAGVEYYQGRIVEKLKALQLPVAP